jgi:hypothetical protein
VGVVVELDERRPFVSGGGPVVVELDDGASVSLNWCHTRVVA